MKRLILASLLLATPALAQTAPDVVLIPRNVAEAVAEQIRHPNIANNIDVYALLEACVADNLHAGMNTRMGQDQCAPVTEAIAARDKQIADLTAKLPKDAAPPTSAGSPDAAPTPAK